MPAESVELGTIYLVDLVGSTQLASSVGPVRADALREELFGLLREAIAASGGDEFKNTGDGLMVAFTSASAAVACAVLTQQLFERRYRNAQQRLHVRIGLGTGESTRRDGDYFGMPATEASRLCDHAPVDGILVSAVTRTLAARIGRERFEPFGALELKGIPEPMETYTVRWEPLDPEQADAAIGPWPLPAALRVAPRVAYVGREAERARLEHARGAARAGARQVVLIAGEPGIGKTRLASYAALEASMDGFAVGWGTCSEDLAAPYEPWIAVCTQLVEHLPDAALADYVDRFGGEVGRVAQNLVRRVPDAPPPRISDPDTERLLLFNAIAGLLDAAAAAVPLYVVLDDFHWADGQSIALLRHVVRTVEQGAMEIVVTYRDTDVARDHPLTAVLADLQRIDGLHRVALAGLGADEVARLMRTVAGHDLAADGSALAAELADETGGNPFFVGEMLRSMAETGTLALDATMRVPESVRDVIGRRVDRLGSEAREILTAAAIVGRSVDVALVAALVDVGEARLLNVLEEAVGASLMRESAEAVGRFTFEHALINDTLYAKVGATRRARLHQRAGEALEAQLGGSPGARIGELAGHWDKAAGLDAGKAIAYARLAGDHALSELAPDEARRWFERALELLGDRDDPGLRCDLLIGLGEAQHRTGDAAYRQTLLDASAIASALEDGVRAAHAALANNRGQISAYGHIDAERIAAIDRALELDDDADRRARLLAGLAVERMYETDPGPRVALADEALAIARAVGRPHTTAPVLTNWFRVRHHPAGLAERLGHTAELEAAAAGNGDSPVAFMAEAVARHALVESGQIERAREPSERMAGIAERLGDPELKWIMEYSGRACWMLLYGDVAGAERHAQAALELGTQIGQPDALMIYGAQIVPIRILQGRHEEILGVLDQAVEANPRIVGFQAAKAQILGLLGRTDEAQAMLAEAVRRHFDHVPWEQTRTVTLAMYAEAAAQTGARDAAEMLSDMIEPAAEQIVWNGANTYGHQRIYLGLLAASLGRHEAADAHFARAIEFQERENMLVWAARARLGWAEALAARGDHVGAREHATRALALCREHGYGLFEPRAAAIVDAGAP